MSNGYFMASEACCVCGGGRRQLPINDCPANTCSRMKKTETFPAWTDELDCPSCPSNPLPHTVLTANENATPTHIPKTPQQAANSVLPIPATSALSAPTFHNAFQTAPKHLLLEKPTKLPIVSCRFRNTQHWQHRHFPMQV